MFIDASPLPVCANKRIFNHKVAKKAAKRGKSTMGWFFGFKLHILIDDGGNLLGVTITPGNVDDRTQVKRLVGDIMNSLLIADAGYLKGLLQQELFEKNGIQFVTGVKRTMKKLMTPGQHSLLRARQLVETVIGSCKHRLGMAFRLHRSIGGYQVHFVLTLIAYTLLRVLPEYRYCLPDRNCCRRKEWSKKHKIMAGWDSYGKMRIKYLKKKRIVSLRPANCSVNQCFTSKKEYRVIADFLSNG